jgi:hypothetical protein
LEFGDNACMRCLIVVRMGVIRSRTLRFIENQDSFFQMKVKGSSFSWNARRALSRCPIVQYVCTQLNCRRRLPKCPLALPFQTVGVRPSVKWNVGCADQSCVENLELRLVESMSVKYISRIVPFTGNSQHSLGNRTITPL